MANPQLENGHTRIANEILEALISSNLSGQEISAALYVIRKTYGYNKKEDYISLSQFQTALNISKTRASQLVNSLQLKKILTVKENINGLTKKYIFNKHLKEWCIPLRKNVTVKEKRNNRSSISKQPLRKSVTTKDNITKDNITKDNITKDNITKDNIYADFPDLNLDQWKVWLDYKKKIKSPYKTENGERVKIQHLINISNKDKELQKEIIRQSIDEEWKGLFPLKKETTKAVQPKYKEFK